MPNVQIANAAGDIQTVNSDLLGYYGSQGWSEVEPAEAPGQDTEELRGAALDAALEEAGLSKHGTADEKRARLADHNTEE